MIRDHASENLPVSVIDTGEEFDCAVVGGGISGLAAALFFKRQAGPRRTCLVLENHRIFGGEARRNEFNTESTIQATEIRSRLYPVRIYGTKSCSDTTLRR